MQKSVTRKNDGRKAAEAEWRRQQWEERREKRVKRMAGRMNAFTNEYRERRAAKVEAFWKLTEAERKTARNRARNERQRLARGA